MPLMSGKSKGVISENIREFRGGKTFSHTKAKFGARRAGAQAVAVAMKKAGKSRTRPKERFSVNGMVME